MTKTIPGDFEDLWSKDREAQNAAYYHVLEVTNEPVDWAYDVWDEVLAQLTNKDNHNRAIAAQLLSNLAKSDPDKRIVGDFDALFAVVKDERFVTARHALQSLWKVGAAGKEQQDMLVSALDGRYKECAGIKNGTLIRFDIIQGLRDLYDAAGDESIKTKALELIELEEDPKYRKKYAGVWKNS